jgi:hypothetical protein
MESDLREGTVAEQVEGADRSTSIIGLTGFVRHGKDSVGAVLTEKYGYTRFAFADSLREMARRLNPIIEVVRRTRYKDNIQSGRADIAEWDDNTRIVDLVDQVGWDEAKKHPEIRRTLQVLGTECVRDILGDQSWINALEKKLIDQDLLYIYDDPMMTSGAFEMRGLVVITDVRFPNEEAYIRRRCGQVWRISRINPDGSVYDNGIGVGHASEAQVMAIKPDKVLIASTLEQLERRVDAAMR